MDALGTHEPWSRVAQGYATHTHPHLARYALDAIRRTLTALDAGDDAELRALDLACGSGAATLPLAERVGHVTAVDFAPEMLDQLRTQLELANVTNVTIEEADGQSLPCDDACFDLAVSMFGLMFFPDRAAGLGELRRCVRTGGRVALGTWVPLAESPAMQLMVAAMRAALPELPEPEPPSDGLDSPARIVAELRAAGFDEVEVHRIRHDIEIESAAGFWRWMSEGSAPIGMIREHLGDDWEARSAAAVEHLEATLDTPTKASMPALIAIARRP